MVNNLKHIKIFEDFDIEGFMNNPEEYFHDDSSPEIVPGDYITSYRGVGQVIDADSDFLKVQLLDGPRSIIRVPIEMAKKIKKAEAVEISSNLPANTKKELSELATQLNDYISAITVSDDEDIESISGNIEKSVEYLEDILIEVISLNKKDSYTTYYRQYADLVSGIASLAHSIIEKTEDDQLKRRVDVLLDKFYEISN